MKRFLSILLFLILGTLLFSRPAKAATIVLDQGTDTSVGDTIGSGRGVLIKAKEDFRVSSIGIYADLDYQKDYSISIYEEGSNYSIDGNDKFILISNPFTASAQLGGETGNIIRHQNIAIDFLFEKSKQYFVNFTAVDKLDIDGSLTILENSIPPPALPYDYALFDLLQGSDGRVYGTVGNIPNNDVCFYDSHAKFTFTTTPVPEPETIFLLGIGLLGIIAVNGKKTNSKQANRNIYNFYKC